jgi:hypothetical protein
MEASNLRDFLALISMVVETAARYPKPEMFL